MSKYTNLRNKPIRFWITLLIVFSMTLTLFISVTAGYRMTKETLIKNTLNINEAYAEKMADSTEVFFTNAITRLEAFSKAFSSNTDNKDKIFNELNELYQSDNSFNSLILFNDQATVVRTVPESLNLNGKSIRTIGTNLSLEKREPVISEPYFAITGRLIVLVSVPVWDEAGTYKGFLAGTIYLEEENALKTLLQTHFYDDGSYLYVVDSKGHLIYHPIPGRIGENVSSNKVVQTVIDGKVGSQRVINTKRTDMLAGFAPVHSSGWGVISQTPTKVALQPLLDLVSKMFIFIIPFFIGLVVLSLWLSGFISKPLRQLSNFSEQLYGRDADYHLPSKTIQPWYHEANVLKNSISAGVSSLHEQISTLTEEAQTDPLTNLANRRAILPILDDWIQDKKTFSIMVLDIDHFKQINDTYGHDTGDEVLLHFTDIMKKETRMNDIVSRYGGEEFIILLPNTSKEDALKTGERIRKRMEASDNPVGETITVSIGIAMHPNDASTKNELIVNADKAMYMAKKEGRNRTSTV